MPIIAARGASVEGLKKLSSDVSDAVDVEKANDLARDRRTDIRAQNDADRLVQRHHARADKARRQHDRRRRALDDRRDHKAQQKADERIVRHLFHRALEGIGRTFFQSVAHQAHAVQEQRQTAKEGDQVENRHKRFKPLLLYYAAATPSR